MRIQSSEEIDSVPILEVRRLLRGVGEYWTGASVIKILGIPRRKAKTLIDELNRREFIEAVKVGSTFYWKATLAGNALALATAAGAIRRETADRVFAEFLSRVEEVNNNPYYLYRIKTVILFGSYLESVGPVGDIDLAIELVPKEGDAGKASRKMMQRGKEAEERGRRFSTFMERLLFASTEVWRFLKSRSRTLSLHDSSDPILERVNYRVIIGDPAWKPENGKQR